MLDSFLQSNKQCDRCQFFAFSDYIVCALHPSGPAEEDNCLDYDPWPDGKIMWAPVGVGFYEVEETQDAMSPSLTMPQRSLREQLEQIEMHPIFSGRCPQCSHKLGYAPRYLWNCDRCGWKDNLST